MDQLKGAVGLGGKDQEGQEPVSGAKGEGTTGEPFDSGNKQEATQAADKPTEDASEFDQEHAYLGSAIDADQERAADASKSEPTTHSTAAESPTTKEGDSKEKKGGFFKSIGLGGGSSKKKEEEAAEAGAEKEREEKEEREKHLPPNHLGSAVPEGQSKDLADPGTVAPGQTDGLAASGGAAAATTTTSENDPPRSTSVTSDNGKQPDRSTSVGSSGLSPDRARSGQGSQLLGSRGEHRGSMIPEGAVKYKRVENPNAIPTAGGKRIGEEQYQTRRASMAPPSSPPRDMAKLDREGSPDPVTADNTASNTVAASQAPGGAEGKNTAPQQMKEFSMGDASANPTSTAGKAEDVAPDEGRTSSAARSGSATSGGGSGGLKDKLNPSSPSSGGGHGRRGSVFDKIKEKVKGGKSGGSKSP